MSILTSLLAEGTNTLSDSQYGMWVMSSNYSVPTEKLVGVDANRFPFNTLKSGSFPDFNTGTNKLTVTKKGIYALSWNGILTSDDTQGGSYRASMIRITTNSLSGTSSFIGNQQAIAQGVGFPRSWGIAATTFLDVNDVVEFGFEHDGFSSLSFSQTTTLRITLLHTL